MFPNMSRIEVSRNKPRDFQAQIEVAAVYIEVGEKLLLLQKNGSESGYWAVPAGKREEGESPEQTPWRELKEETGIEASPTDRIDDLGKLYIRKPEVDFIYHMFRLCRGTVPSVTLSKEHQQFGWFSFDEMMQLPLMQGAQEVFSYYLLT